MIEIGKLSEFNMARSRDISECNDTEIVTVLSENRQCFPNIYFLLTETTKFYTEKFPDLQKYIKREKRLVVFETPSRVTMTHEYTIEGMNNQSQSFHFLFNTRERLSWLKIFLEDKRVSIASRAKVISLLKKKLDFELENLAELLHISKDDIAIRLYEASDGKPCFIEFNHKEYKGQQSLLLSITFFDSIRNKTSQYKKRWWSPLQEKLINYNYSTISGNANAWIYFKSPSNFVLSASHNAIEGQYEASPSNDDEITSLVLTPKGEKLSIDFDISINVPQALKVWYNIMLYLAYAGILWGLVLIVILYGSITDNMIETFNNCSFAIIAALIATTWVVDGRRAGNEENIQLLYFYYLHFDYFIMTLSFMYHAKLENTSKLIQDNRNNELSIPIDSVVNDIHNNINAKVNDTLNNIGNIKFKVCDSLQIKNQNKSKTSESTKKKSGN